MSAAPNNILYCHCAYAQVIPDEVKRAVLLGLVESKVEFESVPDLCEMSARRDPLMKILAERPNLRIAACYARAVKGLFHSAGCSLPETGPLVVNLRVKSAEQALSELLDTACPTSSIVTPPADAPRDETVEDTLLVGKDE